MYNACSLGYLVTLFLRLQSVLSHAESGPRCAHPAKLAPVLSRIVKAEGGSGDAPGGETAATEAAEAD